MVKRKSLQGDHCPSARSLDVIGDWWSLLIVRDAFDGMTRFGEFQKSLGIARNILSDRLRRLESERVVRSTPYSERPPRFTYQLTPEGAELAGALRLLADWGSRVSREAEPLRHAACGTPMEARWYCPTCARAVESSEADEVRYL